jgi:hypothetical protein
MIRRIHVRARVRDGVDLLHRPALAFGPHQVLFAYAEEHFHLRQSFGVVRHVMNFRGQRFGNRVVLQRNTEVDQAHGSIVALR